MRHKYSQTRLRLTTEVSPHMSHLFAINPVALIPGEHSGRCALSPYAAGSGTWERRLEEQEHRPHGCCWNVARDDADANVWFEPGLPITARGYFLLDVKTHISVLPVFVFFFQELAGDFALQWFSFTSPLVLLVWTTGSLWARQVTSVKYRYSRLTTKEK